MGQPLFRAGDAPSNPQKLTAVSSSGESYDRSLAGAAVPAATGRRLSGGRAAHWGTVMEVCGLLDLPDCYNETDAVPLKVPSLHDFPLRDILGS